MSELAADTALTSVSDGVWDADINPRWNIGTAPNGGYLLAMVAGAMRTVAGRPDPLSLTAHYLSPPTAGPATVEAEVVKPGRSYVNVAARLVQQGREKVRLLGVWGDLDAQRGPTRVVAAPPDLPPPDACTPLSALSEAAGRLVPEAMHRYDVRLPPDTAWGSDVEGQALSISGWIRLADGSEPDALAAVAFADAFPPTPLGTLAGGWVPTLELTVHLRARPVPGWIRARVTTRFVWDGLLEEDGELWDDSGRLVALSRQLALIIDR